MCSNSGAFQEVFVSGVELETIMLYAHLFHIGIFAAGLSFLRKSSSWDTAAKLGAGYITLLLAYTLGLSGLEYLLSSERLFGNYLRFAYLGFLLVACAAIWSKRNPNVVKRTFSALLILNALVSMSFLPLWTQDVQLHGCGATLSTKGYRTNFVTYSGAISGSSLMSKVQEKYNCETYVENTSEAKSLVFHGPFTIRRADGSVKYGRFSFGSTNDELIACSSFSEPVEF